MLKNLSCAAVLIASLTIATSVLAQTTSEFDTRLSAKFSKKELQQLTADELDYWIFYLDNCYDIVDIPKEKPDAVPAIMTLKSMDRKDINVFELGLKPHAYARDYFRIEGTDKMMVVLPLTEIDKNYKARSN